MPILIEIGYFIKDNREGKPLRGILRELYKNNSLYFLPQVSVVRKDKNVYWYFNAL
jgi:hypothetical protein